MIKSVTIQKNPVLAESSNYELLRSKGLEYIRQLGSSIWTDYNIHDPGITILELLSYAITDLSYRTDFDIKDLLAEKQGIAVNPERQAFYSAQKILTVNPCTSADFRKLLIDIDGVKNAWLAIRKSPCDNIPLYVDCKKSELSYTFTERGHDVDIKGMYDVLVEFEDTEGAGNLNSGKIFYNFSFVKSDLNFSDATIEMRLPSWPALERLKAAGNKAYEGFRGAFGIKNILNDASFFISANKTSDADIPADEYVKALRKPLFATFTVEYFTNAAQTTTAQIAFEDIPFFVWGNEKKELKIDDLKMAIADASGAGIVAKYLDKIKRADTVIDLSNKALHSHRNLCEDWCSVAAIEAIDIAVCADMEVDASADIEAVIANVYYAIDQYFSPDLRFYSLQQLLDAKKPVDEIFEGPVLRNGFIDNDELDATNLKTVLYTSDIINIIMDIPGVKAVRNFSLAKYDEVGNQVDTQLWKMDVPVNKQPRLYVMASKILVFKNGLTFLPDKSELNDTLQVIKGKNAQPQFSVLENDLTVPKGTWFDLKTYTPLQYQLPLTYGVGFDGIPDSATAQRKAQAKQLKAYLLFFEQLFINYLEQLSHVKELFAIDNNVQHTYFSRLAGEDEIKGTTDLYNGLTPDVMQGLIEAPTVFQDRRNRFLDHQLARFAESFNEYALMLYSFESSKALANEVLIENKVSFLKDLPFMSANRAKAFNYKDPSSVCSNDNIAGLKTRIERLLGLKSMDPHFEVYEEKDEDGVSDELRWRLKDDTGEIYLSGSTRYAGKLHDTAREKAWGELNVVKQYLSNPDHYTITKKKVWTLNLVDETGEVIATRKESFSSMALAEAARDKILAFAGKVMAAQKIFIVEHLLLRPRQPDDPLLPICVTPDCNFCGEEDPYSFRLTIVMNGEEGIGDMINSGIEFRRFAEHTIRMEVPAHLGVKICWVRLGVLKDFETKYCDWLEELAKADPKKEVLTEKLKTLMEVFNNLKSVYPAASLHDCADGNDNNRVFLNQTII